MLVRLISCVVWDLQTTRDHWAEQTRLPSPSKSAFFLKEGTGFLKIFIYSSVNKHPLGMCPPLHTVLFRKQWVKHRSVTMAQSLSQKGRHRSSQTSSLDLQRLHLMIHEYKVSFFFLFISQGFLFVFKTESLCHPG